MFWDPSMIAPACQDAQDFVYQRNNTPINRSSSAPSILYGQAETSHSSNSTEQKQKIFAGGKQSERNSQEGSFAGKKATPISIPKNTLSSKEPVF